MANEADRLIKDFIASNLAESTYGEALNTILKSLAERVKALEEWRGRQELNQRRSAKLADIQVRDLDRDWHGLPAKERVKIWMKELDDVK